MAKAPTPVKKVAAAPKGKEVAIKKDGALTSSAGALFAAHAGAGMETMTAKDFPVPRIGIIQALSPQATKGKPEYDPNTKPANIHDIGLGEDLGDEIMFIPITFQKKWLEWYPRNTGKGLARIHDDDRIMASTSLDEKNRPVLENKNYIAETAQYYGFSLNSDNRLSFIPMASTQLKKSRAWNTLANSEKVQLDDSSTFTPPLYYRAYKLTTQPESNAEGSWFGWKIERGPRLEDMEGWKDIFDRMVETQRQLSEGTLKGDLSGLEGEIGGNQSGNGAM